MQHLNMFPSKEREAAEDGFSPQCISRMYGRGLFFVRVTGAGRRWRARTTQHKVIQASIETGQTRGAVHVFEFGQNEDDEFIV